VVAQIEGEYAMRPGQLLAGGGPVARGAEQAMEDDDGRPGFPELVRSEFDAHVRYRSGPGWVGADGGEGRVLGSRLESLRLC
jgi:hypothetical protein